MSGTNSINGGPITRLPDTSSGDPSAQASSTDASIEPSGAGRCSLAAQELEPPPAGVDALLSRYQLRDLTTLFARQQSEALESSPEHGFTPLDEADAEYGGHDTNFVPNVAVGTCNEGRSYCDAQGDIVHHALAERSRQSDQFARACWRSRIISPLLSVFRFHLA
jgi:hypothetical protein